MNWGASYGSGRDSSIVQGATPVVAVTAVTATGKLREQRQWELGTQAGLRWKLRARLGGGKYEWYFG